MGELTVRSWEFKGKAFLNTSSLETILELSHTIYFIIFFFWQFVVPPGHGPARFIAPVSNCCLFDRM